MTNNRHFDEARKGWITLFWLLLLMAGLPAVSAAQDSQDCSKYNVTLEPFEDVCANGEKFSLAGGSPSGEGVYFVDGEFAFDFDPRLYGPGEYTITYIVYFQDGCMVESEPRILTVHPAPELSFNLPEDNYCAGQAAIVLEGGFPEGGNYFGSYVEHGAFNAAHSGAGTFKVFYGYTNEHGCYSQVADSITILPAPPARAGNDTIIAAGAIAELQAQDANPALYSYQWAPDPLVVNPGAESQTTALSATTLFTLTVTDPATSCLNTDDKVVFVSGGELSIMEIDASATSLCPGQPVQLSVLPTGGSGKYSYQWTASPFLSNFDGSLRNPVAYPEETTLFTVVVTDEVTGIQQTEGVTVTVEPPPSVTLELQPGAVCGNETLYLFEGGFPEGGYYSIPTLNLYNITSINPSQLPAGQYLVTYTLPDTQGGCPAVATQYLRIHPRVKASFYPQQDWCQTDEVTFLNLSENGTVFEWHIENMPVYHGHTPPPHTFPLEDNEDSDTTQVILKVWDANGCMDEYVRDIVITRPTVADFEVEQAALSCSPHAVSFINTTTGPAGFYQWEFGDGSISHEKDPIHTFENYGTQDSIYTVTLTVMSDNFFCITYDTIDITVHPKVSAGFSFTPPAICDSTEIQFVDNSTGALTYAWDFGNGETSTESDPVQLFENNTGDPLSYLITQTVTSQAGCTDTAQQRVLVYPDHQPAFSTDIRQGCSPLTVTFEDQSTGAISGLVFDMGDGSTYSVSDPVHTFKNLTDKPVERTVTLTTDNGFGCPKTAEETIMVDPELKADFVFSPASVCSGTLIPVTNNSSGHITAWQWLADGSQVADARDIAPLLFENEGPDPATHTITLNVKNDYCDASLSRELVVNPEVTADFEVTVPDPCDPLTVLLVNHSANASAFIWELSDGSSFNAHDPLPHTFPDPGDGLPVVHTVSLFAVSDSLCSDYIEKEITLGPVLKADFNIPEPTGCSPFTLTIENASQGAETYQWKLGDVLFSEEQHPVYADPIINTTGSVMQIPVTLTVTNVEGCTMELVRTITVYPEVTAAFEKVIDDPLNCHPLQVAFDNKSSGHATSFYWDFEGGSSSVASPAHRFHNTSFTDPQDYQVTLTATSAYGCEGQATDTITVNPRPAASFSVDDPAGCSSHEATLINESEGAGSYEWDYGDNSSDQNGLARFTREYTLLPGDSVTTYKILLEAENTFGCTDTLSQQVTVFPPVIAAFEADDVICHSELVEFTNISQGGGNNVIYEWDYGDGTGSAEGAPTHSHRYTSEGTYTVILTATTPEGCASSYEMDITVLPAPLTRFTIEDPIRCASPEITVENLSATGATYLWDFGDGTPQTEIADRTFDRILNVPAGSEPGIFDIILTATDGSGCTGEYRQTVTIYPEVDASFTVSENDCHPLEVELTNTSSAGASIQWDLGDGTLSQKNSLSHTYFNYSSDQTATYDITLTATSPYGCEAVHQHTVSVYPVPSAGFSLLSRSGCAPFTTGVLNLSEGADTYSWDMGDGTTFSSESPEPYTWNNPGEEPLDVAIQLTATNSFGCQDQALQIIKVFPQVTADFTTADGLFEGCSPFAVQFENQSTGEQTLHWDFGNNNTAAGSKPGQVFDAPEDEKEVFAVTLTATSAFNCKDEVQKNITVYPSPTAAFKATPIVQTYPQTTVTLENESSPGNWDYHWDFGDGQELATSSRSPFAHQYDWQGQATRNYNIVLTTSNEHCSDTTWQQVTITTPEPVARFIPETQGCAPLHVAFENLSEHAHSYQWSFGEGGMSVEKSPSYTFYDPGTYQVKMVATGDGGSAETTRTITVFENPVASFRLSDPLLEVGQPLLLTNQSQGADYFSWDFGDGNHSTVVEPEHAYQHQGTYTITLVASTANACHDTLSLVNSLRVQEPCTIYFPNAFKPDPSGPSGGYYTPGDPGNTVFHPLYQGIGEYTLEIYNRWGELIFRSNDPAIGWDGYVQGRLSKMDVYVWRFTGRCHNGKTISKTGDVTLYR